MRTASQIVTDNGNTGNYDIDINRAWNGGGLAGGERASIQSLSNTQSSALQVTLTFGASVYGSLMVYEMTNADGTPVLNATGSHKIEAGETGESPTVDIDPTVDNCSIFAGTTNYPQIGAVSDAGYTLRLSAPLNSAYHNFEEDVDVGVAGARTLTFGANSDIRAFCAVAAAYEPPAAGGAAPLGTLGHFDAHLDSRAWF